MVKEWQLQEMHAKIFPENLNEIDPQRYLTGDVGYDGLHWTDLPHSRYLINI